MPEADDLKVDPPDERALLGAAEIAILARYGRESAVEAGEVLFSPGDASYDLVVVLEGRIEVIDRYGSNDESSIVLYGPREFLGELGLLTGQRPFLTAVARTDGRVIRLPPAELRRVMAQEPGLSESLLRAFLVRRNRLGELGVGPVLVGSRFDAGTRRMLELLARQRLSFRWLELEADPEADELLRQLDVPVSDLPIVVAPGCPLLRNPTVGELLAALGLIHASEGEDCESCDLLVLGGGPAGLSAAVYGASEGMATTLVEESVLGGQAGTSSRIENYLGFPAGLSGFELAERGVLQAEKFGVSIRPGSAALALEHDGDRHRVRLENGEAISAKAVIVATGARYNRLDLDRLSEFEGVGVYYAASQMEAKACAGRAVVVVGGGNSAGQAALFLARRCTRVHLVIRRASLASTMSRYLIDELADESKVSVIPDTEVVGLVGGRELEGVELRNSRTRETLVQPSCALFVFIGASPATAWLGGQLATDEDGFLLTGADVPPERRERPLQAPLLLETSRPGVFCAGDVRSGSMKRVAAAIGEGSTVVRLVFDRLQSTGLAVTDVPPLRARTASAPQPAGRE